MGASIPLRQVRRAQRRAPATHQVVIRLGSRVEGTGGVAHMAVTLAFPPMVLRWPRPGLAMADDNPAHLLEHENEKGT